MFLIHWPRSYWVGGHPKFDMFANNEGDSMPFVGPEFRTLRPT